MQKNIAMCGNMLQLQGNKSLTKYSTERTYLINEECPDDERVSPTS